ncbi:MAG: ATP synthase F0 subunit B [Acidobacteriota bacterium]|nr:ATP synthase F0 subunit B [Acidobacteriota bacterium]MDQ3419217.1 ATP synthase F0 subunit B [Acidobacteriota bacterium]
MNFPRIIIATALLVCVVGIAPLSAAAEGGSAVVEVGAKLLNFGLLIGVLVYFLRAPVAGYLSSRSAQIRQDLVTAAEMRAAATAQLAEIEKRMQALPAELEALKRQGAEDVKAEQARIIQTAAAERTRLLEQTRREIDTRMRIARRELTEQAAALAVGVAETRIRRTITPDDQMRLVDRYVRQLSAPGGAASRAAR